MTVRDVVDECVRLACPLVEITGGEPLAQKQCGALAQQLIDRGFTVLCETSGALPIDLLPDPVIKVMDLKCPGSGEVHRTDWSNIGKLSMRDEVKFVIADRRDYEWSREMLREHQLEQRCRQVLFSPVFGSMDAKSLVEWILEDRLPVRFQLQLHKFVWHPDTKGV
jgi:7-carboxy-7-deazaguanine synthase